jgi:hypothetical protein
MFEGLMKRSLASFVAICAAGLLGPAARATTTYSIDPVNTSASPGDVGDAFDVVFTNNGPATITVAAFAFEVTVADTDITLTGADFSTVAFPYIFAGDSFSQINGFTLDFDGLDTTNQTLMASDVTNDDAVVTLISGQSLALGEVLFNVANPAATGPFTVSFTCSNPIADCNNLATIVDGDVIGINVDNYSSGTITIGSVPEPSSLLLGLGGMGLMVALSGRKRPRA